MKMKRKKKRTPVFKDFSEYWYYAKCLSTEQRITVFKSLTVEEKQILDDSYLKDGWSDLFYRNEIDEKVKEIEQDYGYNLLNIRQKAIKKKSVYVPTKFWKIVKEQMDYKPDVVDFVMGNLHGVKCKSNPDVSLIIYGEKIKDLDY